MAKTIAWGKVGLTLLASTFFFAASAHTKTDEPIQDKAAWWYKAMSDRLLEGDFAGITKLMEQGKPQNLQKGQFPQRLTNSIRMSRNSARLLLLKADAHNRLGFYDSSTLPLPESDKPPRSGHDAQFWWSDNLSSTLYYNPTIAEVLETGTMKLANGDTATYRTLGKSSPNPQISVALKGIRSLFFDDPYIKAIEAEAAFLREEKSAEDLVQIYQGIKDCVWAASLIHLLKRSPKTPAYLVPQAKQEAIDQAKKYPKCVIWKAVSDNTFWHKTRRIGPCGKLIEYW